jgi:Ca2+/Na+ antiporter
MSRPKLDVANLCGAVGIILSFVVVLAVCLSAFTPHRTKLSVRADFGVPQINDLRR